LKRSMACPHPFREWIHILCTQDPPSLPAEDAAWLKEVILSSGRKVN
jgi:hypothetical protein